MFGRVTTYEGSLEQIERGVQLFKDEVTPWLRDAHGYRGWIFLLDREKERGLAVTFWATEAAAKDDALSGAALRDEVVANVGVKIGTLDFYEVEAVESLSLDS